MRAATVGTMENQAFRAPKVPAVFLTFWVIKLLTTGIGETGSDFMGTHSIPVAGVVGVGGFFAALWWQLRARSYHPVRYWTAVLMVAVFGTMIADGPHVVLGTPYWVDSIVYLTLLCALLAWWYTSEGTLSVHSIVTSRRERFYWGTVLLTFGLGTALGDAAAIDAGLGFARSIALFGVAILVPLVLWRLGLPAVGCFWASYALTRPLGASIADYFSSKPPAGLGMGTGPVTAVGLLLFAALVTYVAVTHSDEEEAHRGHRDQLLDRAS